MDPRRAGSALALGLAALAARRAVVHVAAALELTRASLLLSSLARSALRLGLSALVAAAVLLRHGIHPLSGEPSSSDDVAGLSSLIINIK